MLGLALIYFIGKYFYELADDYEKSRWGFAILGVVSYYAGTFIGGIIVAIFYEIFGSTSIQTENDIILSFMVLPFGLLACWGLYTLLKRRWSKNHDESFDMIDEIGREQSVDSSDL